MAEHGKDRKPEDDDIKLQLEKICRSDTFAKHAKLKDLLQKFVQAAMAGTEISEDELGVDLFDKPKEWLPQRESAVRERKRLMKKKLAEYYVVEGSDDHVIFEFPNRGRLNIRFNPLFDAAALVQSASEKMNGSFPEIAEKHSQSVIAAFAKCIKLYPSYAPAYAGLAEACVIYAASDVEKSFPVKEFMERAEASANKAIELDARSWLGHLVAGVVHACRWRWEEAGNAFEIALRLDPEKTRLNFFFIAYLEAIGRTQGVDDCLLLRHQKMRGNRFNLPIECLISYLRNCDGEAYRTLINFASNGLRIETDDDYLDGKIILKFDFWPAYLLVACLALKQMNWELAVRYADAGFIESNSEAFPGMLVLAYSLHGKAEKEFRKAAEKTVEDWKGGRHRHAFSLPADPTPVTHFSKALAYMGLGKKQTAIEYLSKACDEGYPWMMFLHRWPLFDDVRETREFQELIARLRLPALP